VKQASRRASEALSSYIERCSDHLADVAIVRADASQLADEVGGEPQFQWQLIMLRYLIEHPPDDDEVRELYGELLDTHRNVPSRVQSLRTIGERIRFLEDSGALPAVLIARNPRK
jgi:hypothetical protein